MEMSDGFPVAVYQQHEHRRSKDELLPMLTLKRIGWSADMARSGRVRQDLETLI